MSHIFVKSLKNKRKKSIDSGEVRSIKESLRKGDKVTPAKLLLIKPIIKGEVLRFTIGKHFFRVFYHYGGGQECIDLETMNVEDLHKRDCYSKSLRIGVCAEIIAHKGQWMYTKYGHAYESFKLNLTEHQVERLVSFLGFEKRRGNAHRFYGNEFKGSVLHKGLKEWAGSHKQLANRLNSGDYTSGILNI